MYKNITTIFMLLLTGCIRFEQSVPWKQPNNTKVICNGNICCYHSSSDTLMCVSSEPFNGNVIIYIKIIEK